VACVVYMRDIFILKKIMAQDKICILIGNLLGWNMKLALIYNLHLTKVYVNSEKYVIHFFDWKRHEVHATF
jgi:hypothetical protein